tara:strand:+ start:3469 stop:3852 length:384 start_codon:yes stop_codon:yes gene_type:complete
MSTNWIPEIMYEEAEDGITSKIPFIHVPDDQEMPKILFMFESRDTGEFEPGLDGEEVPVTELDLHQYASMAVLKEKLNWAEYDNVRFALGLEAYKTAAMKGQKITSNVRVAVSEDDTTTNTLDSTEE